MTTTQTDPKHDVFVGNLSYNTTAESLQEIFCKVGTVANVRIVTDRDTGRPRGFAFIEYDDAATALSAIRNLDGYDLNGRKVCYNILIYFKFYPLILILLYLL